MSDTVLDWLLERLRAEDPMSDDIVDLIKKRRQELRVAEGAVEVTIDTDFLQWLLDAQKERS